jgi:hypothetical protein
MSVAKSERGCPDDAKIMANVQAPIDTDWELAPPHSNTAPDPGSAHVIGAKKLRQSRERGN